MNLRQKTVDAVRILSAEAIQRANSGHPGLPLGSAPIGVTLFYDFLKFSPENPRFENRDRFILSAGHGSMLNYALLYLFGYDLTKEDLMNFRQFGSKTPGHPEYGQTPGIETTTGPLGQGIANAVGMAIAESYLAARFNRENFPVVDHYTYALVGDGCLQEGIENEAASLAGTLKLGKLIVFYDDNDITIEGNTDIAFREDVGKRHEALGWQVIKVADANDLNALRRAVKRAKAEPEKPSLIICKSVIGYGSPLAGSESCHGAPLGADNLQKTKDYFGWTEAPFEIPAELLAVRRSAVRRGRQAERSYAALLDAYRAQYPALYEEFRAFMENRKPDFAAHPELWAFDKADATRGTSSTVLNRLAKLIPNLIGGSADLGPSNKSRMKERGDFLPEDRTGSNLHFGIREHAMAAIANGICLHGGLTVYCATFFVFSDYMKNAMRLSALMNLPVIYILTHDSIGVGEDGPTHQPVEHVPSLRLIPGVDVWRPCDGAETAAAWIAAVERADGPSCLILSRQGLAPHVRTPEQISNLRRGGYVLRDCAGEPEVLLLATGSEVDLAVQAAAELAARGRAARVVSMPCCEAFERQDAAYRESVLPSSVRARVAVEAAASDWWRKYVGLDGRVVGMTSFGESAPAGELFARFGFTVENVVRQALELL